MARTHGLALFFGAAFSVSIMTAAVRAAVLLTAQPGRGPRPRLQKPAHPEDAATMPTLTPPLPQLEHRGQRHAPHSIGGAVQGEVLLPDCLVEVPLCYVYQGS